MKKKICRRLSWVFVIGFGIIIECIDKEKVLSLVLWSYENELMDEEAEERDRTEVEVFSMVVWLHQSKY